MKAEYKRDLQNNYLILQIAEEKEEDDYSIHMVEKNHIPGLLPVSRSRMDGSLYLNYEITGKQPLAGLYEKHLLRSADILFVLTGIREILETLQKYLLGPEKLIFDPQFIFTEPEQKRLEMCYAPGMEDEASISVLAEFILKRLDHQDSEAVSVGYLFYAKTQEENFSLQSLLKEILVDSKDSMHGKQRNADTDYEPGYTKEKQENIALNGKNNYADYGREEMKQGMRRSESQNKQKREVQYHPVDSRAYEVSKLSENEFFAGENRKERGAEKKREQQETYEEDYQVIHKTRSSAKPTVQESSKTKKEKLWIFRMVHPAVLLTTLFLLAVLEVVFYFGYLRMTEAGGAFFLILSVAVLVNSYWKRAQEEKESLGYKGWDEDEEEENEEYGKLLKEMYERQPKNVQEDSYIGETRCLTDLVTAEEMRLIHVAASGDSKGGEYSCPDILIQQESITIGKIPAQCEVLLHAPAVSRVHARLEYRQGKYFLKDLNSRNGTFLNGERLMPQEAREFTGGDRIAFADVQYRVVKM